MTRSHQHRLEGLEPDNLLGFLALLGLLRSLEAASPDWHPTVGWTTTKPPIRPCLHLANDVDQVTIAEMASTGISLLSPSKPLGDTAKKWNFTQAEATANLLRARENGGYAEQLWSALMSDSVVNDKLDKESKQYLTRPTPLCLVFGQGHQHFPERLNFFHSSSGATPRRPGRKDRKQLSECDFLVESLFGSWQRLDDSHSFRWDHDEDVRYALRAHDPTQSKTKNMVQHGANRLAAIGMSAFTVVPQRGTKNNQLGIVGGRWLPKRQLAFCWPIWTPQIGLSAIQALLSHPYISDPIVQAIFGVVDYRYAKLVRYGKYFNIAPAKSESRSRSRRASQGRATRPHRE